MTPTPDGHEHGKYNCPLVVNHVSDLEKIKEERDGGTKEHLGAGVKPLHSVDLLPPRSPKRQVKMVQEGKMQEGDRQQGLVRSCQVLFPWSFHFFFGGGGDRDQARACLPYQWRSPACCSQLAQGVLFLVAWAQHKLGVFPSFTLSLSWEGGYSPWHRCRCRRAARTGTSGRRVGT